MTAAENDIVKDDEVEDKEVKKTVEEPLDFDKIYDDGYTDDLAELKLVIYYKEEKKKVHHILRELDGDDRDDYMQDVMARARNDSKGKPTGVDPQKLKGMMAKLLSICLYRVEYVDDDPKKDRISQKLVAIEKIKRLPGKTVDKIHTLAKRLSGIDVGASKAAKND